MVHKFEKAGLGKAPFKFIGCERKVYQAHHGAPCQPGGSCDYCGTAITYFFWCKSSDGKTFKVGCDCIFKVGDVGLKREVDKVKREQTRARMAARIAAGAAMLYDPELREKLEAQPHPNGFTGKTLLDWCNWMIDHAGTAGKTKVARVIEGYAAPEAP